MKTTSNLTFRCSSLGRLMTNGRGKSTMGMTAKDFVRETWIGKNYHRRPFVQTKPMIKGTEVELDSMELYTQVTGELITKYEGDRLKNDWIGGTPDAVLEDSVLDIKSPFDIFTFSKSMLTPLYEWQLRGYMMLLDKSYATLAYCLVNAPADMVEGELRYLDGEDYDTKRKLLVYDDIDPADRIRTFRVDRDMEKEQMIIDRVEEARRYASEFTLSYNG